MGLTTWDEASASNKKQGDVIIVKNHLDENELHQLNRLISAYLDFAENMTLMRIPFIMEDWEKRFNSLIEMLSHGILTDEGKISAEIAKLRVETKFEKYRLIRDNFYTSDYDRYLLKLDDN